MCLHLLRLNCEPFDSKQAKTGIHTASDRCMGIDAGLVKQFVKEDSPGLMQSAAENSFAASNKCLVTAPHTNNSCEFCSAALEYYGESAALIAQCIKDCNYTFSPVLNKTTVSLFTSLFTVSCLCRRCSHKIFKG